MTKTQLKRLIKEILSEVTPPQLKNNTKGECECSNMEKN